MDSKESLNNDIERLSVKGLDYSCRNTCAYCDSTTGPFSRCTSCLQVSYCNKACQTLHWKQTHKQECGYDAIRVCNKVYAFIGNMQDCPFRRDLVQHAKGVYALALRFNSLLELEDWKLGKKDKYFYNQVTSANQIKNIPPLNKHPKYDAKKQVAFFVEVKLHKSNDYAKLAFVIGIDFEDNPGVVIPL